MKTTAKDSLVLLIPDGVGLRNFVLGPFVSGIDESRRVQVLHIIPEDALDSYRAGVNGNVDWHRLVPRQERPVSFGLRNSLSYAQMYFVDNPFMRMQRRWPIRGSWRTRTALHLARAVGRMAASPGRMKILERMHASVVGRSAEVEHYRELFEQMQPSVLFCSNQRSPDVVAPVLAAKQLGIPSASFIYSWDNLTTKGRIAAPFDHFLVWSDHMREELLRYYPDVSPDRIHVVGTPQFDVYADKSLLATRTEFFHQIGADPERPLICYSGGDVGNSREDAKHVRVLMELVRSGQIHGRPQVLLRPAPVDNGERYADVRHDFPELIYAPPKWLNMDSENWAEVIPSSEDVRFLANLTHHADINVNFASTMTLDFAIHDKPVVNVAFDVSDPPVFGMPMWDYLQVFDHYRPVIELQAARFARSSVDLAEHVNAYLKDPHLNAEGRRRFVELEVGISIGQSASNVIEALHEIARK